MKNDELDLASIINIFWNEKKVIFFIVFFASIFSVFYSLSIENKFQSSSLMTVISDEGSNQRSFTQLGSFANLAGISIPQETNKRAIGIAVIQSREFTEYFIKKRDIKADIMASIGINNLTGKLEYDDKSYDYETDTWVKDEPSIHQTYDIWSKEIFSLDEDSLTGFITLNIKHYSPQTAYNWSNWFVEDFNDFMRARDIKEAEAANDYLYNEANLTSSDELKSVFYLLIQKNTEKIMLAFSRSDFLFRVIDPPIVAENKISPNRPLICILGFIFGCLISVCVVIIRYIYKNNN